MKKYLKVFSLLFVVFLVVGCSDSSNNNNENEVKRNDPLEVGEAHNFTRSDGIGSDDVDIILNSFELVDELDGHQSENGNFLIVNMTIKDNTGDREYNEHFLGGIVDRERPFDGEYDNEMTVDGNETNYNIAFDVEEKSTYRVSFASKGKWLLHNE